MRLDESLIKQVVKDWLEKPCLVGDRCESCQLGNFLEEHKLFKTCLLYYMLSILTDESQAYRLIASLLNLGYNICKAEEEVSSLEKTHAL